MENISTSTSSNNTSSLSTEDFPSKAEGIALCSAFASAAVFIVVGNLLTIVLFAANKKLRKKSLALVINMAFADVMLGALTLPLYVYLSAGPRYQLWAINDKAFYTFYRILDTILSQASLISAVFISIERFYAIYRPLKHRTLSVRAYRIVIFMVWTLAILFSMVFNVDMFFLSELAFYASHVPWTLISLTFLIIVCGCNIGIWRKFQHGSIASRQENRTLQNQRLTKTLLFVSVVAVLSWLPLIISNYVIYVLKVAIPRTLLLDYTMNVINYSNSFVNPLVYALRIPEFKQALGLCCFRRRAVMNREGDEGRDNRAVALTPVIQLGTLPTDPSHLQLEEEVIETKL